MTIGLPDFIEVDGAAGSAASGLITGVAVARYQTDGVNVNGPGTGPPSPVLVKDNVVTGGARIPTVQAGIVVGAAAGTEISRNRVSDSDVGLYL
ncbi:hypothetical protein [Streptomyces sp. NPDC058457]|uniref:hypothetical protein n=1 Tax=Streptomyces sp. NPDC058457 TaxID=3346507 RepID=UPI0036583A8D